MLPGLKQPVEILTDRWGIPHIYAKELDDAFFAQDGITFVLAKVMPRRRPGQFRQSRNPSLIELLDLAGHVEGVAPRQLLDDEHEAGAVVDDGIADQGLVTNYHIGYVADPEGNLFCVIDQGATG